LKDLRLYIKPKNALASTGGAFSDLPDPLAEISNFKDAPGKAKTCNTKFPIALKNYLCL